MKTFKDILIHHIRASDSYLCVGLDVDPSQLSRTPSPSLDHLRAFTRKVIDSTLDSAAAYKLNFAFFERHGWRGIQWLEEVVQYIGKRRLIIADAKRGDISNSAKHYATALFDYFDFDAVTVNPYMGRDSILPFLTYGDKGVFVVCLTSNASANELQLQSVNGQPLYDKVVDMVKELNQRENCGLVVGGTHPSELKSIRERAGDLPFLIPGIGAQGGDLKVSVQEGNRGGIALIPISRAILYAGDQSELSISRTADRYRQQINRYLYENEFK